MFIEIPKLISHYNGNGKKVCTYVIILLTAITKNTAHRNISLYNYCGSLQQMNVLELT
jgi:hypothetical protein